MTQLFAFTPREEEIRNPCLRPIFKKFFFVKPGNRSQHLSVQTLLQSFDYLEVVHLKSAHLVKGRCSVQKHAQFGVGSNAFAAANVLFRNYLL